MDLEAQEIDKTLLFVDGMNLFIRSYLVDGTINANGDLYGGATGFIRSLKGIIKQFKPSQVFVCWEQGGGSPKRKAIFSEYKANRSKSKDFDGIYKNDRDALMHDSETKTRQLAFLTKCLGHLPIVQIYVKDCEGDDIVAYLIKNYFYNHKGTKYLVSSDKDFYQLLDKPNVKIYSPIKKEIISGDIVLEQFKIHPKNFCLAKAICGDLSDNIPGVPGIKFDTASKRFPFLKEDKDVSIDEIIQYAKKHLEENKKKPLKCYVEVVQNEDIIRRNWQLMYLDISLTASQIEKIKFRIQEFQPKVDMIGFLKCYSQNSLAITQEIHQTPSDLKYLCS